MTLFTFIIRLFYLRFFFVFILLFAIAITIYTKLKELISHFHWGLIIIYTSFLFFFFLCVFVRLFSSILSVGTSTSNALDFQLVFSRYFSISPCRIIFVFSKQQIKIEGKKKLRYESLDSFVKDVC